MTKYLLIVAALLMAAGCCHCPVEIKATSYLKSDGWVTEGWILQKRGKWSISSIGCDSIKETDEGFICENIVIRGAK